MPLNLIESINILLPDDFLNKAAGILNEHSTNVQQAMKGIIPTILTGVLHKAGSGEVYSVLNIAVDSEKTGIPENLKVLMDNGDGQDSKAEAILGTLFGDRVQRITNAISSFSGTSPKSAHALLCVAAPAAMGVLGKQVTDSNLNAAGLLSFLNAQKENILTALPSGLNIAGLLDLGNLSEVSGELSAAVSSNPEGRLESAGHAPPKSGSGSRWILPVLVILMLMAVIGYFINRRSAASVIPIMSDTVAITKDTTSSTTPVPQQLQLKLPDGKEISASKGGMEDLLLNFLNDPAAKPGKNMWFDFDQLNFNSGTADITSESIDQIENVGSILKAYHRVKIKIGGSPDQSAVSQNNKKLYRDRFLSVAAALKGAGAKRAQIIGMEEPDKKIKDQHFGIIVRAK
jgi:outer membrane protein OmpA-like peptidoglycan-associated protein